MMMWAQIDIAHALHRQALWFSFTLSCAISLRQVRKRSREVGGAVVFSTAVPGFSRNPARRIFKHHIQTLAITLL